MAASERDTTTKVLTRLDADVEAKKSELARLQSGWCEDRWTTIKISQEIGALQREHTTLSQRLRQLKTVDEGSTYRGAVFSGSNF
jgi:hypothetical protein